MSSSAEDLFQKGMDFKVGRGVAQDYKKAMDCFLKAGKQGHVLAQLNAARCYDDGCGVPQDYKKAVVWYKKAADQGDAKAEFHIAVMYHHGKAVMQDYVKAKDWYKKSASKGYEAARLKLDELEEKERREEAKCNALKCSNTELEILTVEIPMFDIEIGEKLGEGDLGIVRQGVCRGIPVALKVLQLRAVVSDELAKDFRKQIVRLTRIRHPNVVETLGAQTLTSDYIHIASALMENSISLYDFMRQEEKDFDLETLQILARGIAAGMGHLHLSGLSHEDLKSTNILLDLSTMMPKICDYGLLRVRDMIITNKSVGRLEWMAPELLRREKWDNKVDVYSYGMILWELFTHKIPFFRMSQEEIITALYKDRFRLEIPGRVPPVIKSLIQACWHSNPAMRPTFAEIQTILKGWSMRTNLETQQRLATPPSDRVS